MKIVFRVDASNDVGFGHLSRCVNLAEVLRSRGNDVLFICRNDESKSFNVLEDRFFKTCILPRNTASSQISQEADADETIEALDGLRPSWLVVDSYELDDKFEQKLRGFVEKIAVIEDLAVRRHDCDLLIDQNYSDRTAETFKLKVPDTCKFLIGPKYALINPVFAKIREVSLVPKTELKRIFVFCGGSDPKNLTKTVLDALGGDEFSEIKVDVVIGSQNQNFKPGSVNQYKSNIQFYESGDNFATIMSSADLVIGAGGTTTWERMCLGLPSIVVSIADNQVPACEKLGREGLVRYLGPQSEVNTKLVAGVVREFLRTPSALGAVSIKSQIVVDGRGCDRVAEVMCPSGESDLKVRLAETTDCIEFFNWANDPVVRKQSLNTAEIQWIDHQKWFGEKIKSDSTEIYVLEASGLPVGQVRFDLIEGCAEIDYSLDEIVRGRGWSPTLLEKSIEGLRRRRATSLRAVVKGVNTPSRAVFFKIGFKESESLTAPPDTTTFYRIR